MKTAYDGAVYLLFVFKLAFLPSYNSHNTKSHIFS
nr:MAG TPA: hypothetical protein [Caudoviricetes sp.]